VRLFVGQQMRNVAVGIGLLDTPSRRDHSP
jgi:hypothetical protein